MSKKDSDLDAFWDLSDLIPKNEKKNVVSLSLKPNSTVDISFSHDQQTDTVSKDSTVIKRYINPLHDENKRIRKEAFSSTETYIPEGSLLHSVTLKKRKSNYQLYEEFVKDAKLYALASAEEVPFVSFFSYVPQYNQLSAEQLAYYLWWRENFKKGVYIKTELSYILLYIYEIINIGKDQDIQKAQYMLTELWNVYHKEYSSIAGKLAIWICDFSLMHKLIPPTNIGSNIIRYTPALKEYYIHIPNGDYEYCVRSLLKYGTEYDYKTSKFATEQNLPIFDKYIFGAMLTAVKFFSNEGRVLSALASEDSKLVRNVFDGALCASSQRYELEVKYCSFSRSNELRYIMGDIVKYSENKIRGFLGIKSKLSVYSIGNGLQTVLDTYFEDVLSKAPHISKVKKEEKHDYDVLYETPERPLSLENARKIENDSWSTTFDLVSAFEENEYVAVDEVEFSKFSGEDRTEAKDNTEPLNELSSVLREYLPFVLAIKKGDINKAEELAKTLGKLVDSIVDTINEISADIIGDILIEDTGFGFEIIECYREMV